jgi:hypothetical protein
MSNWPIVAATRYETLGITTGQGVVVTTGAINTKGSAATIGTTGFAYKGFHIALANFISTGASYRVDVIANSGTDEVIVQDFHVDNRNASTNALLTIYFPIAVAAGAVLKVRAQASTATLTFRASIIGFTGSAELQNGFRASLAATDFTNSDPTNSVTPSGTTQTGWTTMQASTPARFAGLYVMPTGIGSTSGVATQATFDIGHGTAGNEVPIVTGIATRMTAAAAMVTPMAYGPFFCDIGAASRLAFRMQNAVTSNIAVSCAAWGLVA